nr:hypothetical protein [candidate division Zixibacteria bacterium]
MMKKLTMPVLAVLLVFIIAALASSEEKPWFDMANCDFCKHLLDDPALLDHTVWEHHNISNGLISVTTVDKEYLPSLRKASHMMDVEGEKFAKGEPVKMCGMCQAMGMLMQKGVKYEVVETQRGSVMLMTSADPEVVKLIQDWGKRNIDELKKWEETENTEE